MTYHNNCFKTKLPKVFDRYIEAEKILIKLIIASRDTKNIIVLSNFIFFAFMIITIFIMAK